MKHTKQILEEVPISSDLELEFTQQAALFASWGFQHAAAESEARRTEERKDVVWAQLQSHYRHHNPKAKENECKAYILKHPKYREAVEAWNQAKFDRDILRVAVESFKQRKDMLVQLGADKRAELDQTDMTLRKKTQRANRMLKSMADGKTTRRKRTRRPIDA